MFVWGWVQGVVIMLLFFVAGCCITYNNDIRNNAAWVGGVYHDSDAVLVTIEEPLVEKLKSYKALASVQAVYHNNKWVPVKGNLLLYFKKDSLPVNLVYGTQIIFYKPLQRIKNSGNPGSFDYQRFSGFHDIYHQCFLQPGDYKTTGTTNRNALTQWLFSLRSGVIAVLKQYIKDEREQGVAEALLIGYRDDLDKSLVQAYSNTGVVHIIAISGLHLGMIYGSLLMIFKRMKRFRLTKWIKPIVILVVLWTFSLVAGAAPSILRSAVMFSFLLSGEILNKRLSVYNTLAASAFTLLCFNPFALWDVGFQLSYAAVLSIILFMQPIFKWFYIKNKAISATWQLTAVTLSAQVLTIPIVCFHFHQFPNLFLVTNFLVVPLSSFILYGELLLLVLAKIMPFAAVWVGWLTEKMLWLMNQFIVVINNVPFAVTDGIQVSLLQAIIMFMVIIFISYWLMRRSKPALMIGAALVLLWASSVSADLYQSAKQNKLIIYNVPQHTAIDFIEGRAYQFAGDTVLLEDDFLQNFHLKPARIQLRITPASVSSAGSAMPFYYFNNKKILVVDKPYVFTATHRIPVDIILLSKNPKVSVARLAEVFDCRLFVFDGSNGLWKMKQWKKECDSLHLRHYSTQDSGALQVTL